MFPCRNPNIFKTTLILTTRKSSTLEPVRLAYASYENTGPVTDQEPAPLIVNHGLLGSKSNWNSLCKAYLNKTNRKVIAVDARNHGDSPHDNEHTYEHLVLDLKELLKQLRFDKVALLGHSMGGRTVMYFALKYPSLVEKLIVADISPITTSPNLRTIPTLFNVLQDIILPRNVTMASARSQADLQLAKSIDERGLRNFLLTNLILKSNGSFSWRVNIPALKANFDEIARFPLVGNLVYQGPVLFIGGEKSDYIKERDHNEILKMFPNSEFRYVKGAGHWLHSEKPVEFLEHTVEFLNKNTISQ